MDWILIILTIMGLCLFEVVSSIDNAIINANVLKGMNKRSRRWFLTWGILLAVFLVRGAFPLSILWIANPQLALSEVWGIFLSNDPRVHASFEHSAPILLVAGGTFLILLFLRWLFLEQKDKSFRGEDIASVHKSWFFPLAGFFLVFIVWHSLAVNPMMAFSAVVGSAVFFTITMLKTHAGEIQSTLHMRKNLKDPTKIAYLEVLDAMFSIDSVLGAFAFTLSVPLIIIGNGLGAIVVRKMTMMNLKRLKRYAYLKNGAMYSIFFLGIIMIMDSFGTRVPSWVSPVITFMVIGYFFRKSTLGHYANKAV
ncbi:DUF475 domain-containing protein [Candidatus Woesearchaeota archaeon]|nr:DUF475 domain-containing protein [Candidatus Woesearchaeota archaeon]